MDDAGDWERTTGTVLVPWSSCPREMKLASFASLPDLLDRMADRASEMVTRAETTAGTVRQMFEALGVEGAIGRPSQTPPGSPIRRQGPGGKAALEAALADTKARAVAGKADRVAYARMAAEDLAQAPPGVRLLKSPEQVRAELEIMGALIGVPITAEASAGPTFWLLCQHAQRGITFFADAGLALLLERGKGGAVKEVGFGLVRRLA